MDHSKDHFYEAYQDKHDAWRWKVYHYDVTGNKEIIVAKAERGFDTRGEAEDAANDWLEEHDIDAELHA